MNISIIGTGYVGLVTGACFAEMGNTVVCHDIIESKIKNLENGQIDFYEPGLSEIVSKNCKGQRLRFTSDLKEALENAEICIIAVGTPMGQDGSADIQYVMDAAQGIGRNMVNDLIVVNKSTVPVGSADKVLAVIKENLKIRNLSLKIQITSNPEFLKEGSAVEDFMRPDRVVIGAYDEYTALVMKELYSPFIRNHDRFIMMDVRSAEMTKYAANSMLAARISFMNEMANICELVDADVNMVRLGMGSDNRIGYSFLYAGCGYGGSCFPKDVKALIKTALENNYEPKMLGSIDEINARQKRILAEKVIKKFGTDLCNRKFAIWGVTFKPETDDIREAPSLVVIEELLRRGAEVRVYDPIFNTNKTKVKAQICSQLCVSLNKKLIFESSKYDTLAGANGLILVTEWKEFRSPDFAKMKKLMENPIIFDGRNLYHFEKLKESGFQYFPIGRK